LSKIQHLGRIPEKPNRFVTDYENALYEKGQFPTLGSLKLPVADARSRRGPKGETQE
jgi:hypothetical protein